MRRAWENLDDFLSVTEFADVAELELSGGERRSVTGIFDDPYMNAELGEYNFDTNEPRFMGKETDFTGVQRGDVLRLNGQEYDILASPMADGTGMATLRMSEVQ